MHTFKTQPLLEPAAHIVDPPAATGEPITPAAPAPAPAVLAILAELARPASILAASLRPWLTMLQGAWWMQTAYIM